jgi:hypothetical protein
MENKHLSEQQQLKILQDIIQRNRGEYRTMKANKLNFDSNFQTEKLNDSANVSNSQS